MWVFTKMDTDSLKWQLLASNPQLRWLREGKRRNYTKFKEQWLIFNLERSKYVESGVCADGLEHEVKQE